MTTFSRYDFMNSGTTKDEVSGSYYPDPLTLNYLDLNMSEVPLKNTMTDAKIITFWNEAHTLYGVSGYDDIILTLNGIPHKNFLMPGDTIYFPILDDITTSFAK
mgnify:CR=1 FL=1|nr:MAG TPA: hypothetical protein [Bacteriophage sp.]